MPEPIRMPGDLYVTGNIGCATMSIPANTVVNAAVSASADITSTKLEMQRSFTYSQNGTAASATIPIHVVYGATCSLVSIKAVSIVANIGAATVTVDLKKNGSSVLSAVITLDSANTARVAESGTITTAGGVAGDLYELVIVATAGGGTLATGLGVTVIWSEKTN